MVSCLPPPPLDVVLRRGHDDCFVPSLCVACPRSSRNGPADLHVILPKFLLLPLLPTRLSAIWACSCEDTLASMRNSPLRGCVPFTSFSGSPPYKRLDSLNLCRLARLPFFGQHQRTLLSDHFLRRMDRTVHIVRVFHEHGANASTKNDHVTTIWLVLHYSVSMPTCTWSRLFLEFTLTVKRFHSFLLSQPLTPHELESEKQAVPYTFPHCARIVGSALPLSQPVLSCGCSGHTSLCHLHHWSSQRKMLNRSGCTPDRLSLWRHCRHRHPLPVRTRVTETSQWSSGSLATWSTHRWMIVAPSF